MRHLVVDLETVAELQVFIMRWEIMNDTQADMPLNIKHVETFVLCLKMFPYYT